MQCFVLGTGGMMPLPRRRLSSVVVRPSSTMIQLDCGENAQVSLKELRMGIKALRVIATTHLHADHCLGIPGVLMFRAQCEEPGPLTILGTPGIERFVRHVLEDLSCFVNFPVDFVEWSPDGPEVAYEDEEVSIRWAPLEHRVTCVGYRIDEHPRPGRFDADRARALPVPEGPLWGDLQRGETVTLDDGRTVSPGDVLGPERRGRAVAYVTDTAPCPSIEALCADVDLAFIEGMFMPEHEAEGVQKMHLTVEQAVSATRRAGARRTALIHLSPRYGPADLPRIDAHAASVSPTARVARDLETFDVPLPD